METIALNIKRLQETKVAIKQAIINKGQSILDTDPFYLYASKIAAISGGRKETVKLNVFDHNGNQINNATIDVYYWDTKIKSLPYTGTTLEIGIPEFIYYTFKITGTNYQFDIPSYTAVKDYERSINLNGLPSGVFIYGIDGKFYGPSEWNQPNDDAVGVAVMNENTKFVISKNSSSSQIFGQQGKLIKDIFTTTSTNEAKTQGYDGEAYTNAIIKQAGINNVPAAKYCRNTTFPNGKHGYLGSAAQWYTVFKYKKQVNACMSKCGGNEIEEWYLDWGEHKPYKYITSTQYNADSCWNVEYMGGVVGSFTKTWSDHIQVRPFATL